MEIWAWLIHCLAARRPHLEWKVGPGESLVQCDSPVVKLPPAGAWEDIMVEGNALSGTVNQALRCPGSDAGGAAEWAGYYLVMLALTEGS